MPEDLISPVIPKSDSHLILGLDPLETLRNLNYISEKTLIILNTYKKLPKELEIGRVRKRRYESHADILDLLDQFARRVITIDFYELSKIKCNDVILGNIIMLGLAVEEFRDLFYKKLMIEIIKEMYNNSADYLEAFNIGYNLIQNDFR
jgi:Pyruvate/2-oxoacid:ferredoxin oxidoreductase gamma subunit